MTSSLSAPQQRAYHSPQPDQAAGPSAADDRAEGPAVSGPQPLDGGGDPAHGDAGEGRKLVLVVDDEREIRAMLAAILHRLGYETLSAGDGRAALAQFAAHLGQIAVVLLDVNMPVMSGGETLRALRILDPAVPVLLISGYAESDLGGTQEHPAVAFLQKPFTIAQIQTAVAALVTAPA